MSIKRVYDTTALLSISLIKKQDLLRKTDIAVFVPFSVVEELEDISKYRDKESFKRVSCKKRMGTKRFV